MSAAKPRSKPRHAHDTMRIAHHRARPALPRTLLAAALAALVLPIGCARGRALVLQAPNSRREHDPIEINVQEFGGRINGTEADGSGDGAAREEPGSGSEAVDKDVDVLEGGEADGARVGAIVGGVLGGMLLFCLCICAFCCCGRRSAYVEFLPGGSLSDRSSLVALREFASGGFGGGGEGRERGGGGWWRTGRREKDGRYAADSLEMDFGKAGDESSESRDLGGAVARGRDAQRTGVYLVDDARDSPGASTDGSRGSDEGERKGDLDSGLVEITIPEQVAQRGGGDTLTPVPRGESLVKELGESDWAQVERDVADFDYVIGVGPAAQMEGWMQTHLSGSGSASGGQRSANNQGRQGVNNGGERHREGAESGTSRADSGGTTQGRRSAGPSSATSTGEVEDPPLMDPFGGTETHLSPRQPYDRLF